MQRAAGATVILAFALLFFLVAVFGSYVCAIAGGL